MPNFCNNFSSSSFSPELPICFVHSELVIRLTGKQQYNDKKWPMIFFLWLKKRKKKRKSKQVKYCDSRETCMDSTTNPQLIEQIINMQEHQSINQRKIHRQTNSSKHEQP